MHVVLLLVGSAGRGNRLLLDKLNETQMLANLTLC